MMRSSPIATVFSSEAPSAKPAAHRRSTSFMNPKVRARDNSRRNEPGVEIDLDSLAADHGAVEIDLDVEMETVMRGEFALGASIFHGYGLQDFQVAAGS